MALNRSPVRHDLPFLRRRVKAAPTPPDAVPTPAAPDAAPARSTGLDLGGRPSSADASAAPHGRSSAGAPPVPTRPAPFAAPRISELRVLGPADPVLRLDARQSAIGSLIVSGTAAAVWESADLVTGSSLPDGAVEGVSVPTPGNRPLVGYDAGDAIITLRHLRLLRRALFLPATTSPSGGGIAGGGSLGVQIFDGETVAVAPGDGFTTYLLSVVRIGPLLELRAEPVAAAAPLSALRAEFGFTLTAQVAPREPRRR